MPVVSPDSSFSTVHQFDEDRSTRQRTHCTFVTSLKSYRYGRQTQNCGTGWGHGLTGCLEKRWGTVHRKFLYDFIATLLSGPSNGNISWQVIIMINETHSALKQTFSPGERTATVDEISFTWNVSKSDHLMPTIKTETTHWWRGGVVLEFDLFRVPVFLQIQALLFEHISRDLLPVYGRLHVGREYVVEDGAEQVDWAGSQVDVGWRFRKRDVGRGEEFR